MSIVYKEYILEKQGGKALSTRDHPKISKNAYPNMVLYSSSSCRPSSLAASSSYIKLKCSHHNSRLTYLPIKSFSFKRSFDWLWYRGGDRAVYKTGSTLTTLILPISIGCGISWWRSGGSTSCVFDCLQY